MRIGVLTLCLFMIGLSAIGIPVPDNKVQAQNCVPTYSLQSTTIAGGCPSPSEPARRPFSPGTANLRAAAARRPAIAVTLTNKGDDLIELSAAADSPSGRNGYQSAPRVVLDRRPDSPLLLSSINMRRQSPKLVELEVFVVNTGRKPITAFALGYDLYSGAHRVGVRFELSDGHSAVGPGKSDSDAIVESLNRPISRIKVFVDFVEFSGGDTWGPDLNNNSQVLAGMRAGAREAKRYLRSLLRSEGDKALLDAVGRGQLPLVPPEDHSPTWQESFSHGVTRVLWAIKQRMQRDHADPENVLSEPFDAFEEVSR